MAGRPNILRSLRIDEVSSVDRGAGRGVRVLMTKRLGDSLSSEILDQARKVAKQIALDPSNPAIAAATKKGTNFAGGVVVVDLQAQELGLGGLADEAAAVLLGKHSFIVLDRDAVLPAEVSDAPSHFHLGITAKALSALALSSDAATLAIRSAPAAGTWIKFGKRLVDTADPANRASVLIDAVGADGNAFDLVRVAAATDSLVVKAAVAIGASGPLAGFDAAFHDRETYHKREFSQNERDADADSGAALPDGSFPIKTRQDLKNAVQAVGRAKNPAAAKAHIKRRAEALGATDLLPEDWAKRDAGGSAPGEVVDLASLAKAIRETAGVTKDAVDFEEAAAHIEAAEAAGMLMSELSEALCALDCSIRSILEDEDVADKGAAIAESFGQFKDHLASFRDTDDDALEKTMTTTAALTPAVKKLLDDAVAEMKAQAKTEADALAADFAKQLAAKDDELRVAKMSDKHKKFHDSLSSDDEKKKFAGLSPEDRDEHMGKMAKRLEDDPIIKAQREENSALKKRIQDLEDAGVLEVCKREARELGIALDNAGEVLMKARRGEPESFKVIEDHIRTITKQRDEAQKAAGIFREVGKSGGPGGGGSSAAGATAEAEIGALAKALKEKDPKLTFEQAYAKVMSDPMNRELVARESQERMNKIHRTAA